MSRQRVDVSRISREEEKTKPRKDQFLDDFDDLGREIIKNNEGNLRRLIMKIRLASYKSSIQERPLRELLENECTADDVKKIPKNITDLQNFFKTRYFLLSDESGYESLQLLDSLKII